MSARGVDHGLSILDEAEVIQIYTTRLSLRKIAKKFNISHSTAFAIKHKQVWKQVTDKVDADASIHNPGQT